jgi:hypothetical protein
LLEDSFSVRQGKARRKAGGWACWRTRSRFGKARPHTRRKARFAGGLGLGLGKARQVKARHGGRLGAGPAVGLGLRQGTEKKCGGWAVSRELS